MVSRGLAEACASNGQDVTHTERELGGEQEKLTWPMKSSDPPEERPAELRSLTYRGSVVASKSGAQVEHKTTGQSSEVTVVKGKNSVGGVNVSLNEGNKFPTGKWAQQTDNRKGWGY
jgi:hypothetical protein